MSAPPPPMEGALVLFSGGQDSATCLAWALDRFGRVETVGFDYGQRHAVEMDARDRVRHGVAVMADWGARLGPDHRLDLTAFGALSDTALTADLPIVEAADGLPSTFVPGRNLVFLIYAAALAHRRGLGTLIGGMCETDFSGYPDCRRETIDAVETAINLGMATRFRIETPLMHLTKAETWALANRLGGEALVDLIVEDSHTCYRGERGTRHAWGYGCGGCPACVLRAKGWDGWAGRGGAA